MRFTIKIQLAIGVIVTLLTVITLGIYSLKVQDNLGGNIADLEIQAEKLALLSAVQLAVEQSLMPGNDYIITGNADYPEKFKQIAEEINELFSQIKKKGTFTAEELNKLENAHKLFDGVLLISREIFSRSFNDPAQAAAMEKMDYQYAEPLVRELATMKQRMEAAFKKATLDASNLRAKSRSISYLFMAALVLFLTIAGTMQLRAISISLDSAVEMLREIAEGRGDLTRRISIKSRNELGELSDYFNRFISQIQGIVHDILGTSMIITGSANSVNSASTELRTIAEAQYRANEEITVSTENISTAIASIAGDTNKLLKEAADASSSSAEIAASLADVAQLTERLDQSTDQTLNSITQIAQSSRDVAENVAEVMNRAENAVQSISQINLNADEIRVYARKQSSMSQAVQDNASRLGLTAIAQTKERMERIRAVVDSTTGTMNNLGRLSEEINRIVSIITNITGKTNLLALNASIIAAQTGEHGKGFAIVAGEMKELALKTAESTKEIENMIVEVQNETAMAIEATKESSREVDAGVTLSQEIASAFNSILDNTGHSLQTALEVAAKADEQREDIVKVSDAINNISQMLALINREAELQKTAATQIVQATEEMRSCSQDVRVTLSAQSQENQLLSKILESFCQRVEVIAKASEEQRYSIEAITLAQDKLQSRAEENKSAASTLEVVVSELDRQAKQLDAKVNTFRV